ncbi:MAG: LysM peptidoglycan-binding domain-containing protein [Actinobacteria bacterium]|nr:LysM peptidoglycan-binding domain-containing protein [Actinomycetota bacterium]
MTATTATALNVSNTRSHLRLVDDAEAARIAEQRKQQWQAMQAGHRAPVRLTKRGRRVVALLILAPLALGMWLFAGHGVFAMGTAPTTKTVVVQPGESLWQIAEQVAPNSDPRETIYKIKQMNGLTDSSVIPGQGILVPAGN